MDTTIVAVYALCADILITLRHRDDCRAKMTDAEVITAIPRGDYVQLLERTEDAEWLSVKDAAGNAGWMAAEFLTSDYDVMKLAVAE